MWVVGYGTRTCTFSVHRPWGALAAADGAAEPFPLGVALEKEEVGVVRLVDVPRYEPPPDECAVEEEYWSMAMFTNRCRTDSVGDSCVNAACKPAQAKHLVMKRLYTEYKLTGHDTHEFSLRVCHAEIDERRFHFVRTAVGGRQLSGCK